MFARERGNPPFPYPHPSLIFSVVGPLGTFYVNFTMDRLPYRLSHRGEQQPPSLFLNVPCTSLLFLCLHTTTFLLLLYCFSFVVGWWDIVFPYRSWWVVARMLPVVVSQLPASSYGTYVEMIEASRVEGLVSSERLESLKKR